MNMEFIISQFNLNFSILEFHQLTLHVSQDALKSIAKVKFVVKLDFGRNKMVGFIVCEKKTKEKKNNTKNNTKNSKKFI